MKLCGCDLSVSGRGSIRGRLEGAAVRTWPGFADTASRLLRGVEPCVRPCPCQVLIFKGADVTLEMFHPSTRIRVR